MTEQEQQHELSPREELQIKILDLEVESKKKREEAQRLIPNIQPLLKLAQQNNSTKEKLRVIQRRVLSYYSRYPDIAQFGKHQIISTDLNSLQDQYNKYVEYISNFKAEYENLNKEFERYQHELINTQERCRSSNDEILERISTKQIIIDKLTQDIKDHTYTSIYEPSFEQFEKELSSVDVQKVDLKRQLDSLKANYQLLSSQRADKLSSLSPQMSNLAQSIITSEADLLNRTQSFLTFWESRRHHHQFTILRDLLTQSHQISNSIFDEYSEKLRSTQERINQNTEFKKELKDFCEKTNQSIQANSEIAKEKRAELDKLSAFIKAQKLPPNIQNQLDTLRLHLQEERDKNKALVVEYKLRTSDNIKDSSALSFESTFMQYIEKQCLYSALNYKLDQQRQRNRRATLRSQVNTLTDPEKLVFYLKDRAIEVTFIEINPPQIQLASIEVLVTLIFHPDNYYEHYYKALLMTVHHIKYDISKLCTLIIQNFKEAQKADRLKKLNRFIDDWSKWFFIDFLDEANKPVINQVLQLANLDIQKVIDETKQSKLEVRKITENPELRRFRHSIPFMKSEENIALSITPIVLAGHITYYELQLLRNLEPYEFVDCSWTKNDKWRLSPNIMQMTDHFNIMTRYIVISIINTEKLETRAELITKWIAIMQAAYDLHNYQLVFEIFGALCNPSIRRLKKTWALIDEASMKIYSFFQSFTSPVGRMANYRKELAKSYPPVTLPYIGAELTSLIYINDGNATRRVKPDSTLELINFQKFSMFVEGIDTIFQPWMSSFEFFINENILTKVKGILPLDSDEEVFKKSLSLESDGK